MPEPAALAAGFRGIVLDLDGVVYLGDEVVPAAPAAVEGVRGLGARLAFVTNNSFRPPELVAEKLGRLGVKVAVEEVLDRRVACEAASARGRHQSCAAAAGRRPRSD